MKLTNKKITYILDNDLYEDCTREEKEQINKFINKNLPQSKSIFY
jgi:hypothetical protein